MKTIHMITGFGELQNVGNALILENNDFEASSPLPPRLDLVNHSPTGFAWGYHGSGPAQLALALLCHVFPDRVALAYHQDFKNDVIARRDGEWDITEAEIRDWMRRHLERTTKPIEAVPSDDLFIQMRFRADHEDGRVFCGYVIELLNDRIRGQLETVSGPERHRSSPEFIDKREVVIMIGKLPDQLALIDNSAIEGDMAVAWLKTPSSSCQFVVHGKEITARFSGVTGNAGAVVGEDHPARWRIHWTGFDAVNCEEHARIRGT